MGSIFCNYLSFAKKYKLAKKKIIDMIIGIGNDIIAVSRIKQTLEKFGDTFLSKHFSGAEIDYAGNKQGDNYYQSIASAWAAKEAVAKALGTGIVGDITLSSISLCRNENGAPYVELTGGALNKIQSLSGTKNIVFSYQSVTMPVWQMPAV